jgi:hypothetical protein
VRKPEVQYLESHRITGKKRHNNRFIFFQKELPQEDHAYAKDLVIFDLEENRARRGRLPLDWFDSDAPAENPNVVTYGGPQTKKNIKPF